jgi:hypothetical protein
VGSSGTYTTWQAWEDACPSDITAAGTNEDWIGEQQNEEITVSSGSVCVADGITTDSTHRLIARPVSGGGFKDHANADTNPLRYDGTKGAAIKFTSSFADAFDMCVDFTLQDLQVQVTDAAGRSGIANNVNKSIKLDGCILEGQSLWVVKFYYSLGSTYSSDRECTNCVFVNRGATNTLEGRGWQFYNCTFYSTDNTKTHVNGSYGTFKFVNCLFLGSSDFQNGTQVHTVDYCVTDLASWESSTATNSVLSATASSEVESATTSPATIDLRIKSGSNSEDGGTSTSAPTVDIIDQTRSGTWDVGAWEIQGAGTLTITVPLITTTPTLYAPEVIPDQVLLLDLLPSAESVLSPTLQAAYVIVADPASSEVEILDLSVANTQIIAVDRLLSGSALYSLIIDDGTGTIIPIASRQTINLLYQHLKNQGYTGASNDLIVHWLVDEGQTRKPVNEMLRDYVVSKGFAPEVSEGLSEWRNE